MGCPVQHLPPVSYTLVFSISLSHTPQAPGLVLCWRKLKARTLCSTRSYGGQSYLSHRKSSCFREEHLKPSPVESLHTSRHGICLCGKQKANREFLPLALMETMNISLAGGKLPMTPKHAVVWTMLKKPPCHINNFISYQSAFFLSCL